VLSAFVSHGVPFLVIGGTAVHLHGFRDRPRKDLDLLVNFAEAHEPKREAALATVSAQFGPWALLPLNPHDMTYRGIHIDQLSRMHGVYGLNPFDEAVWIECEAGTVPVVSLRLLLSGKRAMWRPQDAEDLRQMTDCPIEDGRCVRCGAGRYPNDAWRPLERGMFQCE